MTGLEIVALSVAVAGAAASAYASYAGAQEQQRALRDQAAAYEQDAAAARLAGEAAAEQQRRRDRARLRSFGATAGAAGVVAREGSPLLDELDFAAASELEAQHARYGYRLESRSKELRAGYARRAAGRINPAMDAGLSLLSSGASIAGSYTPVLSRQAVRTSAILDR